MTSIKVGDTLEVINHNDASPKLVRFLPPIGYIAVCVNKITSGEVEGYILEGYSARIMFAHNVKLVERLP